MFDNTLQFKAGESIYAAKPKEPTPSVVTSSNCLYKEELPIGLRAVVVICNSFKTSKGFEPCSVVQSAAQETLKLGVTAILEKLGLA